MIVDWKSNPQLEEQLWYDCPVFGAYKTMEVSSLISVLQGLTWCELHRCALSPRSAGIRQLNSDLANSLFAKKCDLLRFNMQHKFGLESHFIIWACTA